MDINSLNKALRKGRLPTELDYNIEPTVDLNRLLYNAFYRTYEFHESKFPAGYESIPGLEKLIQSLADNAKSPLEEMEAREMA